MRFSNLTKNKKILIITTSVMLVIAITLAIVLPICLLGSKYKPLDNGKPILATYDKPVKKTVTNADFYVSKQGNDTNDGKTTTTAFASIEKAQSSVRELIKSGYSQNIVVAVMAGEYNCSNGLVFDERDSFQNGNKVTYTSYDENEVILNGGITLPSEKFVNVSEEYVPRFAPDVVDDIKMINLFDLGVTTEQLGDIYAIGQFEQSAKYDGIDKNHPSTAEVFFNDERMSIARYPNNEYANIKSVVDYGEAKERLENSNADVIDWDKAVNPRAPKFIVDDTMKARMANWKKPTSTKNAIWSFGYYYWDWADASSPVLDFDSANGQIDLKYASVYGIQSNAKHYVFNVLEELDTAGEYYIDRENGNMFFYPPKNIEGSDVQISLTTESVVNVLESGKDGITQNIVLDGFTVKGSRGNGIDVNANDVVINNCLVKNVANHGIRVQGKNNIVKNNEVAFIGKNGIYVGCDLGYKEGDISADIRRNGLVVENNLVANNYIYRYGEIQRTYTAGVHITGVGNTASNNEIFDAPHMGIFYEGNEHIIEYNYLHDVVQHSSDAGAIYAGRNLSYFGNVIRYNCIYNIGSGEFTPSGVYFDDCLAGQTAYGNILINIPNNGFLIGGGRENSVTGNLIINAKTPVEYDARAYDGLFNNGWYGNSVKGENARQWNLMNDAQALYKIWKEKSADIIGDRYDAIMNMVGFDDQKADNNAVNPNGTVSGNIAVCKGNKFGNFASASKKYGTIENNKLYKLNSNNIGFVDFENGDYNFVEGGKISAENPNFERIPLSSIGRVNGIFD